MCGISGIVGNDNITKRLFSSIKSLEYRGYDSCGMAVSVAGKIKIKKNIGAVEEANEKENFMEINGDMGIAHTRWATHGRVTKENTHPHKSCDGHFAVVHNGIISNYSLLRDNLKKEGHTFHSDTDTEVIVHLIEKYYNTTKDTEKAIVRSIEDLEGTFAFAVISDFENEKIFCAKNESPLILGIDDELNYIASDFNAFIDFTKDSIILDDGEYAIVTKDTYLVKNFFTGEVVNKEITKIEWDTEMSKKGGYPHYMLKEIHEQSQTIKTAIETDSDQIKNAAKIIFESDYSYLVGVGTTYYVALFAQYMFSKLSGRYCSSLSADEFTNLAEINNRTSVLALSQSGETYDTINSLKYSKKNGAKTIAIVNVFGSTISRIVDNLIMQRSGPEISVISTKAALSQMIILYRIAFELGVLNGKIDKSTKERLEKELTQLSEIIQTLLNERSGFIHTVARKYANHNNWLYLGRGVYYPVALESSLKMKEVAYVHAEAMPCGFLKHGTIALIDDNLFSFVFVPPIEEKKLYSLTMSSIEEIRARNGFVLGIHFGGTTKETAKLFNEEIVLPKVPLMLAPFIQLVAAQLFSYFTATTLKRNIDRPRSLAKSVTVA